MLLPQFIAAFIAFLAFVVLARLVQGMVRRALRRQDRTLANMLAALARTVTLIFGLFVALWITIPTVNFVEILASLGLTGLVLGFALKDLLENFAAGALILWRRPFRVGDQIRSGDCEGSVEEINFRSTVLKTYDGIKVYIPNGQVFTQPLQNMTAYPTRRSTVVLGIHQNASMAKARAVVLETLRQIDGVLSEPQPMVFFDAVADFTNNLHVLYWTQPPTRMSELETKSEVTEQLYYALQRAGIDFPYPIRTVHLERDDAT